MGSKTSLKTHICMLGVIYHSIARAIPPVCGAFRFQEAVHKNLTFLVLNESAITYIRYRKKKSVEFAQGCSRFSTLTFLDNGKGC